MEFEQERQLRGLGLFPVLVTKTGSGVRGYILVALRKFYDIAPPDWDNGYVPLICGSRQGHILVGYGEEAVWQKLLADKLTEILGIPIVARGD